jgi:hypothetical protein
VQDDDGSSTADPPQFHNFRAVLQAREAAARHGLHHSLRHLLEVIAGFTNGRPAWPSYETLAGITGLSVSRVRQYGYKLVEQGYLTLVPRARPGGGKPIRQWALGPLCQSSTGGPLPQEQSSTGGPLPQKQSSTGGLSMVHGRTIAMVHGRTIAQPGLPDGRKRTDSEEITEENRAPLPPTRSKPNRVADFIDALRARGHPEVADALTPADRKYIAAEPFDIPEFVGCLVATIDRSWPGADDWIISRLSVRNVHQHRFQQWQQRHRTNGAPRSAADLLKARKLAAQAKP